MGEHPISGRRCRMFRQETVPNGEAILVVSGPLSGDAVSEFQRKMEDLCAGRFTTITLDLSQTPSIDSTALGKILFFLKRLTEQGKILKINGCSDGVYKIFQIIKLDRLIEINK
jgi:anti-anti-sigma factor